MRKLIAAMAVATMAVLLALLVSACGGGESAGTVAIAEGTESEVSAACEEEPVSGGSLVYARQLEVVSLNPREIKNGNGDVVADEMIYSGLVRNDPNGSAQISPALAEKWEISPDGKTYTFHLRPGLKFSDGSPVTAEDVAWNLEQFADPEVNVELAALAVGMESAKATNPTTVVVRLERPVAAFLHNIAVFPAFVVPKKKLEAEGAAFWRHPVGTGPFKLTEFAGGSHITFEKNPYYFEEGKPYLQTMRWNFVPNSNTRMLALKSGEVQAVDGVPFSQIEPLRTDSEVAVKLVELPMMALLSLNTKVPALSDVHVRRALNYALERKQINSTAFRGAGTVPNSIFQHYELTASDSEVKPFDQDLAKAKEEMAKSKFADGFSVTLLVPAGSEPFKLMSLLIQQQLKGIGVSVKLTELEAATVTERWTHGEFEMAYPFTEAAADILVPDEFVSIYTLPESETNGFGTFWSDPKIEGLAKKFLSSTKDEAGRKAEYRVLQEELNEQVPSLNVMDFPLVNAYQSDVCGTVVNGVGVDQLQETWVPKNVSQ